MNREDVTLEFYYRKAIYKSPITGCVVEVDIKQVFNIKYPLNVLTIILSTHGVEYNKEDLSFVK